MWMWTIFNGVVRLPRPISKLNSTMKRLCLPSAALALTLLTLIPVTGCKREAALLAGRATKPFSALIGDRPFAHDGVGDGR